MSLRLCILGSGSRGNAAIVRTDRTCLLIDAGLSIRALKSRLAARDMTLDDVDALIADTGATSVEGFNAVAPYRLEVLAGNYILKKGEAYLVKVDSDTTWTVDW